MSVIVGVLARVILRNPKVQKTLDKAVTDFMDGFTREPPDKQQRIEALKKLLQDMKKKEFPDAFVYREDYYEVLLAAIAEATYLKERPLVLSDFYAPGYAFYFPQPNGDPNVGTPEKSHARVEPNTDRMVVTGKKTHFFYAVPTGGDRAKTVERLEEVSPETVTDEPNKARDALVLGTAIDAEEIIAIDRIGKARGENHFILVAAQDLIRPRDLLMRPDPKTRASIVKELEEFLDRSTH